MGHVIEFARPDGQRAPGYLAAPAGGEHLPGVVMLEEWWGLTDQIKTAAERLASAGFRVLVPDLFRGRTAAIGDEANHLVEGLDFKDAFSQDARGAAQYLASNGHDVSVLGYCIGGALAMLCAMYVPEFRAAVVYYGASQEEAGDPAQIKIPILGHFASLDKFFKSSRVDAIEKRLKEVGTPHEFHRYDADHGFANPNELGHAGLGHYNETYAEQAFARTVEFLKKNLK